MNLHEYQAKALLATYGIPVPAGTPTRTPQEAADAALQLGGAVWAVKAQILAGGRGKAGGVRICRSPNEVRDAAQALLGARLLTSQTTADGLLVETVLVEAGLELERELYVALVVDREYQSVAVVGSQSGGTDIEVVAHESPDSMVREPIDAFLGLAPFQARRIARRLDLTGKLMRPASDLLQLVYRCFIESEATQIELNPLVVTQDGGLAALDAKISVDDSALSRHPELVALRDTSAEDPREVAAGGLGLSYVALDGNIGCIVNGAGLAMATMDSIVFHGGRPANFLDIGGGATPEKVAAALNLVLDAPGVSKALINVFAGINRCDWIARGVIDALTSRPRSVPIVVRLAGTNEDEGRALLSESGLQMTVATDLEDAAMAAVAAA